MHAATRCTSLTLQPPIFDLLTKQSSWQFDGQSDFDGGQPWHHCPQVRITLAQARAISMLCEHTNLQSTTG